MGTKILLSRYLTFCFLICSVGTQAQDNCKEIKATIEVFQAGQKTDKASFTINFHGQSSASLNLTLIGPKGFFRKDIQENEVKDLQKGAYTLVITPRREEDNFCQKHFGFTIN